ncbi:MAG: FG-GAP-like repeat-containing protein, partial [Leeuwenhoekiella sp.]
ASVVREADVDQDGDLDLFIGSNGDNLNYGEMPDSYLLLNDNGAFNISGQEIFENLGMVTDAIFDDFDNDGDNDLIVIGEWMSPTFLRNDNGKFANITGELSQERLNGLWQTILPFDIDGDGDIDYLLGNWGLNSKLKASSKHPLLMYRADFDKNGLQEAIVAQEKNGKYYLNYDLDLLSSQLTMMRKKYNSYNKFAGQTVEEIMGKEALNAADRLEIHTLASGYLENSNGTFKFKQFDNQIQVAPIKSMLNFDFDGDGSEEVLLGGNYFGVTPYYGKLDALGGFLIKDEKNILKTADLGLNFFQKSVRNLSIVIVENTAHLLVTYNNDKAELYKIGE